MCARWSMTGAVNDGPGYRGDCLRTGVGVYLLINSGISDNDALREKLKHFIRMRCEAGDNDTELLAVEGLKYLKQLDGSRTG